jgi:hypothetical protein
MASWRRPDAPARFSARAAAPWQQWRAALDMPVSAAGASANTVLTIHRDSVGDRRISFENKEKNLLQNLVKCFGYTLW